MAAGKSNQDSLIDMDKMISYMTREIDLYWSALESNDGDKLRSIHKLPQHILEVDRNAYEPIILSIGPYHHGAPNLLSMEREKWKSLDFILKLNCELSLQDYIRAIYKQEKQAKSYYSQEISMDKMKFIQMLLLDSCFILVKVDGTVGAPMPLEDVNTNGAVGTVDDKNGKEWLDSGQADESSSMQRHATDKPVHEIELTKLPDDRTEPECSAGKYEQNIDYTHDYNSFGDCYSTFAWHDLFLLENQIPFFIIETVYNLALSKCRVRKLLRDKIVECVEDILRQFPNGIEGSKRPKDFHHLLHLCHMFLQPTRDFVGPKQHQLKVSFFRCLVRLGQRYFNVSLSQEDNEHQQLLSHSKDCFLDKNLPSRWRQAVQYHEAGIYLKKREYSIYDRHSLLDVKLSNGVLEVPCFPIDESTESLFKNLIAFEQMNPQFGNYITAYITFMSQFVSTPEDAILLSQRGVIVHMLDSDDEVSSMFTRLCTHIYFSTNSYHYLKTLCHILEDHYQSRLNRWLAWLWRNHFSNPWLALAVLAAVVVLLCTIIQTIFTVLAYSPPH